MRATPLSFSYENPLKRLFSSEFFGDLPETPGVYFMLNEAGEILYVGKAKSLRNRVSSYRVAKPGSAGENILEMLELVRRIRWELCDSEEAAILRERELIQALRPPFNIAHAWEANYLYVGIRASGRDGIRTSQRDASAALAVEFKLTSRKEQAKGFILHGCYKHRGRVKSGYNALLRLLYAARNRRPRFSYPAKITRATPPYSYSLTIPPDWEKELHRFLGGRSRRLLELLTQTLLENETIPAFMYPSLQDDLEALKRFYRLGPKETRVLKTRNGIRTRTVSHRMMDQLIRAELTAREISGALPGCSESEAMLLPRRQPDDPVRS